ncbi:MAG TPA: condensation domain-containing protein, partial [Terriglobales bacterium]
MQGVQKRRLGPQLRGFLKEKLPDYMLPSTFVLLDALPIAPNGKVDRTALPAPDTVRPELSRTFVLPRTPAEETLARIWADLLGLEQVGVHDNFFELGGDSILSIQIIARANRSGLRLTPRQLFEHQTIAALAAAASASDRSLTPQKPVTGDVGLTPIQHWFFEQDMVDAHHFNQAVCLEPDPGLEVAPLEQAVSQLLLHHDALRLRFRGTPLRPHQFCDAPGKSDIFTTVYLPGQAALETFEKELQGSLNLWDGPLIRVALCRLDGGQSARLLIVIHHLAIDAISWRILLEDLWTAYAQVHNGRSVQLPAKTTSFQQWSERLAAYAQTEAVRSELQYWLAAVPNDLARLRVDHPAGGNTVADVKVVWAALDAEQTQALLQEVPAVYHTQINDALLAALGLAFADWTGGQPLLVEVEGHGREDLFPDIDVSRTVGWFTSVFPVCLDIGRAAHPADALKSVKEQLRGVPKRGVGYGLLRYLCRDEAIAARLQALPQAEISFNYLGRFGPAQSERAFPAPESASFLRSPRQKRSHLLEINGMVYGGRLEMGWYYNQGIHRRDTIEALAASFTASLRSIIHHCQSGAFGDHTPSDFALANLEQRQLNRLVARFAQGKGAA